MVPLRQITTQRLRDRPAEPTVIDLDGDTADRVFDALGSETTRRILALIYESPRSPTDLAAETGTTLQNVTYHINKLLEADLIEPDRTHYSEKGQSVISYGPTNEAVVVVAGSESVTTQLKRVISGVFGLILLLGAASATIWITIERFVSSPDAPRTAADVDTMMIETADSVQPTMWGLSLDPATVGAIAFLCGGLFAVMIVGIWWVYRTRTVSN